MDYGKFKFDAAQRAKESRRKAVHVGIKEMKYRPKIGDGDFETKTRQVAKFLEEGHKVKITIMFRGREVFHPELGKKILDRIADQMDGMGKSESIPRLDGRNMVMVLAPDKRAKQSAASREPGSNGNGSGAKAGGPNASAPAHPGVTAGSNTAGSNTGGSNTAGSNTAGSNTAGSSTGGSSTAARTAATRRSPPAAAPEQAGDESPAQESSEGEG